MSVGHGPGTRFANGYRRPALPFRCVGGAIPANIGTDRGLASYLLQQQTNGLRGFLELSSPQALVLTSDWTTKPPTRLYPMGNGPRIVHRVCVVAYVNGQVIDPRLPLRREDLDKLEQIFAVLVFDGTYVDEVEAPPIDDQPQPEMPPQIAALDDTSGYKPRKLRQRRTRRVAA